MSAGKAAAAAAAAAAAPPAAGNLWEALLRKATKKGADDRSTLVVFGASAGRADPARC